MSFPTHSSQVFLHLPLHFSTSKFLHPYARSTSLLCTRCSNSLSVTPRHIASPHQKHSEYPEDYRYSLSLSLNSLHPSRHKVRRQNSTTAEEVAQFQRLFPNPSWLTSGRTSDHQNLVTIFPWIDNCLKAKSKGRLSASCYWEAAVHTLD